MFHSLTLFLSECKSWSNCIHDNYYMHQCALISYWRSFLMYILHDPTSRIRKVSYMNKKFLISVEKHIFNLYWHTTI